MLDRDNWTVLFDANLRTQLQFQFHLKVIFQLEYFSKMSPLWKLCAAGKLAEVRAALARGEDVNRIDVGSGEQTQFNCETHVEAAKSRFELH